MEGGDGDRDDGFLRAKDRFARCLCVTESSRVLSLFARVSPVSFHVTLGIEEFMQKGRYSVGNSLSSASIRETGILIPSLTSRVKSQPLHTILDTFLHSLLIRLPQDKAVACVLSHALLDVKEGTQIDVKQLV